MYGKRIRRQKIEDVVKFIKTQISQNNSLQYISFWEPDFLLRPLEEIKEFNIKYKQDVGLPFYIFVTPLSVVRDGGAEKLRLLTDAGLDEINMGIQLLNI